MSAIIIDSNLVHYEAIGRGKPLLFLHGWLGSWRYWVPTMEELSERYRTYALDLWGFGDSDKSKRYTLDEFVTLLAQFMDQLGIWQAPMVGHALGGLVALSFAGQFSDRVEQVMGVSVPFSWSAIARQLSGISGGNGDIAERVLGRRQVSSLPEIRLEAPKTDAEAVVGSLRSISNIDLHEVLEDLEIPILLVYGRQDPIIRPPADDWESDFEENVRTINLDESRHFPMLEETGKFNRLLKDFLDAGTELDSLELKDEWRRRMR